MTANDPRLVEIQRLLTEAYDHYFQHSDGYCKSSEGAVSLHYPNYFDQRDGVTEPQVSIYSYVLGPSRNHDFPNLDAALRTVRQWHRAQTVDHVCDEDCQEER